jgi:hypothetical protein
MNKHEATRAKSLIRDTLGEIERWQTRFRHNEGTSAIIRESEDEPVLDPLGGEVMATFESLRVQLEAMERRCDEALLEQATVRFESPDAPPLLPGQKVVVQRLGDDESVSEEAWIGTVLRAEGDEPFDAAARYGRLRPEGRLHTKTLVESRPGLVSDRHPRQHAEAMPGHPGYVGPRHS